MPRSSGVLRCSNCGNESEWRIRFTVDERGQGGMYVTCINCRAVIHLVLAPRQINNLRRDGAILWD